MTDQEIQKAIAQECGYYVIQDESCMRAFSLRCERDTLRYPWCEWEAEAWLEAPDYPNDLNAMHEAERYFDDKPMDVRSLWLDTLAVCGKWPKTRNAADLKFEVQYLQARATARRRAEAFLRTVGKWKESTT